MLSANQCLFIIIHILFSFCSAMLKTQRLSVNSCLFCAVECTTAVLDDLLHSDDEASSVCTSNPAQTNATPAGTFLHLTKSVFNSGISCILRNTF